jgi:AsmA-like protein
VKLSSSKRRWLAAAVILLLLFVLRPGTSFLKSRIITSISSGVGRPVDIGSVHFRLLPRPGFDLENLVVYDDPAFGAEPMLRAAEVTAWLRLTSLARGQFEIARLDLTEPSLNLVHGENGRWNLEALLERAARTPLAPTAKGRTEPRPGFPYIDATSARVNLKNGPEKKPYALTNADFSLWQESENAWGLRLQGQPIRSDLNLNDTGVLRVDGRWQRAAAFRDTPLQFSVEWRGSQLGQLTKLFTRNDQGWRGRVQFEITLAGTPAKLSIASDASIQDFRRYDITSGQSLLLAAHCDAQYSSVDHVFREVACTAPVGNGRITLHGDAGLPGSQHYALELAADKVPAAAMVDLAARVKKNLPVDLTAGGVLQGTLSIQEDPLSRLRFEGKGTISQFHLVSATAKTEVGPETVPFVFTSSDSKSRPMRGKAAVEQRMPEGARLEFGPFSLPGAGGGPTARGWVNRSGYSILVTGEADVAGILRVTPMFGIPALQAAADGTAQLDLQVAGSWASGFPAPQVTGTVKLHNVRLGVRGAAGPVEISSADLQLSSDQARIAKLSAKAAGASWNGSLEMPRGCGTPAACQVHFSLNADQILLREASEWISPQPKKRPWYRVLQSSPQMGPSFLASLHAAGTLATDRVQVQNVAATHVLANVSIESGTVEIKDLQADILGGQHRGGWRADLNARPATCSGTGRLSSIPLARLAETMMDPWISGLATVNYQFTGSCATDFWHSAEGVVQFDVRDGILPHVALTEDEGPLRFVRLSGQARLAGGEFDIQDARLDSVPGTFRLSGTASLKRELNLKLSRKANSGAGGFSITGTLAKPRVAPLPGTEQARLKPEPAK